MTTLLASVEIDKAMALAGAMLVTMEERMSAAGSYELLFDGLCRFLRDGVVEITTAIGLSEGGDLMAHKALLRTYRTMRDQSETPGVILEGYALRWLGNETAFRRKRGQPWHANWARDQGLTLIVLTIAGEFGLNRTRNREQRRNRTPSACSVVAEALGERRIYITERTLEKLTGELQNAVVLGVAGNRHLLGL